MKFFELQAIDEVGRLSVSLQKTLIALATFYAVSFVMFFVAGPLTWLGTLLQLVVIYIAWKGATQRHERMLKAYYVFNIVFLVLTLISFVVVFGFIFTHRTPTHHSSVMLDKNGNPLSGNTQHVEIRVSAAGVVGILIAIVFGFALLALKITTIVLSVRLAKMIRSAQAQHLAFHPASKRKSPPAYAGQMYIPVVTQTHLAPVQAIVYQPVHQQV